MTRKTKIKYSLKLNQKEFNMLFIRCLNLNTCLSYTLSLFTFMLFMNCFMPFAKAQPTSSMLQPDQMQDVQIHPSNTLSTSMLSQRLKKILSDQNKVTVSQVAEAMLSLMVQDLSQLHLRQINPMAIRAIVPQAPLSSEMEPWAEARLSALIHQESSIELRECFTCKRQKTYIDDQSLIFLRGNHKKEHLANNKSDTSIQSFLEMRLAWSADRQELSAEARLLSPKAKVIWQEQYRSGDQGELAKRGLSNLPDETSMKTYQKLATPPKKENLTIIELFFGYGIRSGQGLSNASVLRLGVGYGAFFGANSDKMLALQTAVSAFATFFVDINAEFRKRISSGSKLGKKHKQGQALVASQGLWWKASFGIPFSPDIAGYSVGSGLYYMSQMRLGLGLGIAYAFNFNELDRLPPGGLSADLNVLFVF